MGVRGDARDLCHLVLEHPMLASGNRGGSNDDNEDIGRGRKVETTG